jgi:hypothetical protein
MRRAVAALPLRGALAALALGCAPAAPPVPSISLPDAPVQACAAGAPAALAAAEGLAASGDLDAALLHLEEALAACPAARALDDRRRALEAEAGARGQPLAVLVEEGWARREAGDLEGARRAFARVVRAGVAAGTPPRALPLTPAVPVDADDVTQPAARLDEHTLLLGARSPDARGALILRYRRVGGAVVIHPLRFLARSGEEPRIVTAGGRFALASAAETLLFPSPTAPALLLPGGLSPVFADRGGALVLASADGVATFDAATGEARGEAQPISMPEPRRLDAVPDHPWAMRCGHHRDGHDAFVVDARSGRLLARAPRSSDCTLDAARGRLVSLRLDPAPPDRFAVTVDVLPLDGGSPRTVSLGQSGDAYASLVVHPVTGAVSVLGTERGKLQELKDPASPPAARVRRAPARPDPFADLGREGDFSVDLGMLRFMARRPREVVPNDHNANLTYWISNGARSPDGRWLAAVDRDHAEPLDQGLVLADAKTRAVRHHVALLPYEYRWLQVSFLDDGHVTVRQDWTTHVIDVPSGTLRAIVDVADFNGQLPALLGDDLASAGVELVDLSRPRTLEEARGAALELPLNRAAEEEKTAGGRRYVDRKKGPIGEVRDDGTVELGPGVEQAPGWLHCAVGEWVVPFEACARRVVRRKRG